MGEKRPALPRETGQSAASRHVFPWSSCLFSSRWRYACSGKGSTEPAGSPERRFPRGSDGGAGLALVPETAEPRVFRSWGCPFRPAPCGACASVASGAGKVHADEWGHAPGKPPLAGSERPDRGPVDALRRMLAPDAACSYIRAKPSGAVMPVAGRHFFW